MQTSYDVKNCSGINGEICCESSTRFAASRVFGSDFGYIFIRQFMTVMLFATLITLFSGHVPVIFRRGSKPQMIRVDATRVVASVANVHSIRNLTKVKHPTESVGVNHLAATRQFSIPEIVGAGFPEPATIFGRNLCVAVEFFSQRFWMALSNHPFGGSLFLHKSVQLIFATLRAVRSAPGQFTLTALFQNASLSPSVLPSECSPS